MGSILMARTHTLLIPVVWEGGTVTEINMRRPKAKDQVAAANSGGSVADQEIQLMCILCSQPPEVILELDGKDYAQLQDMYQAFLS